jgi:molybdate transport system substrate-binding protein
MNTHLRVALLAACIPALLLPPVQTLAAQDKETDTEIRILCSNGLRAAMEKLLPEYERAVAKRIKVEYGASANFKRSIEAGQPFDLAILTPQLIGDLIKDGKIAAGTAVDIATTGIGVAVRAGSPKPDVSTPQAMKQTLLKAKSIGYVKEGASTAAVVAMLNRLGIDDAVKNKTVFQPGAVPSMASVAGGQTDLAFALISEIVPAPGVQLAGSFPSEFQKPIGMSAGVASSTRNRAAVDKIVKSLTSAEAAITIKATGLDPVRAANLRP